MKNEACQRFIRDSVVSSFTKICCDDAVNAWKLDIQVLHRAARPLDRPSPLFSLVFIRIP